MRTALLTAFALILAACPASLIGREPGEPDGDSAAGQPAPDDPEEDSETGGEEAGETGKPST